MIGETSNNKGRPNEGKYTNINRKKWLWDNRKVLYSLSQDDPL
jgi:hypothetical protein